MSQRFSIRIFHFDLFESFSQNEQNTQKKNKTIKNNIEVNLVLF